MSPSPYAGLGPFHAVLDADGRLTEADPPILELQTAAGGRLGTMLAVPQIAALARLSRRLGIPVSRAAIVADEHRDLELWVRVEPQADRTTLEVSGWREISSRHPAAVATAAREADFTRAASDWVWETDESLRLTMLSASASAATGRAAGELVGKPLTSLFRFREFEDGSLPILLALAERRRFADQLAEVRGGTSDTYRLSAVPLVDGAGRFAGFRGAATRVDDAAAGSVRVAAHGAAEESLRTSIGQIISHAQSMESAPGGAISGDYAGYAADIASAGRHLLALVEDIGDLQAIERPGFRASADPIDLALIARQAATFLAVRAAERRVRLSAPDRDVTIPAIGDHRRTLQILVNLIGNAIRYSPEGEVVEISGGRQGDIAAISVTDRGKGIALEDQERIFEKFERLDPSEAEGTGLGLYIARRLARAMAGELAVESIPGLGARFTLRLQAR